MHSSAAPRIVTGQQHVLYVTRPYLNNATFYGWLLQNTNRKPHAGSQTHCTAWAYTRGSTVAAGAAQKHSLGGFVDDMRIVSRRDSLLLRVHDGAGTCTGRTGVIALALSVRRWTAGRRHVVRSSTPTCTGPTV